MANQEHLDILRQGVDIWNKWRNQDISHKIMQPDLSKANLSGMKLSEIDLSNTSLSNANLREVDLSNAHLRRADFTNADLSYTTLRDAYLVKAYLDNTNLSKANLEGAILSQARLRGAVLRNANLSTANFNAANLSKADLRDAKLTSATFVNTNFSEADLSGCFIFGISAWGVQLDGTKQSNLIITPSGQPRITVDNLEIAQFMYILLNNKKVRNVIDTITSKVVLILGRFTVKRKAILDALREELHQNDFTPVLFDFEKPANRDFSETVRALAHLSRFILADITELSSIPQELQTIVPELEVPVQPILEEGKQQYSMFPDLRKYPWVFPVYRYKGQASLIASLKKESIEPADKKARELAVNKAKRLETP